MDYEERCEEIRKIRNKTLLGDNVYRNLRNAILSGKFKPDIRLVEDKLAKMMGTSRTPVREALRKLDRDGYIRRRSSGGYTVGILFDTDIRDVFEVVAVLEGYAVYLAAYKIPEDRIRTLEGIVGKEDECIRTNNHEEFARLNWKFYDTLCLFAGNRRLYDIINNIKDCLFRHRMVIFNQKGTAERSVGDQKKLLDLIKKRNAAGAEKIARKQIIREKRLIMNSGGMNCF
ncbi:MAG: putative HTH-type transcriptional regulator YdfH [Syntrophorhabdus sp. PtaU1.Bin058]|nr:MAG: putative HTH-type transcriptional regulator YdfH [Syntrophorhabdus sp. PtaU1.Bin058]